MEFAQTDAAGIVHFATFFPMMESVEHEFLRHLGLSLMSRDPSGPVSWPRVHAQCDYRGPARFDDVLTINAHHFAARGKKHDLPVRYSP